MLARSSTIVEITPTRLELAVVSGSSVQQRRVERYNPPAPGTDWAETLRTRHATLQGWVSELGLRGSPATVLFTSPTAVASLPACPAAAGAAGIQRAAVLALAESAGYPIADNPVSTAILFTDARAIEKPGQAGAGGAGGAGGAPQKMAHTLCAVETDANCSLLSNWIASCGLTPARLLPATAAPIARLVERTARKSKAAGDTLHSTLWFGEHESFFIVGDNAGIVLFRALSVGIENIVEALLRPITPRSGESGGPDATPREPITIDRAAARTLLDRSGVPLPADVIDERNGFTGASVLPLMNSVLQRFSVEIKQSLRFGLSDKQRAAVAVTVDGPGARLPRIDAALSQLCGVAVSVPQRETPAPAGERSSSTCGNIDAVIQTPAPAITLLPAATQQAQIKTRARRSLWTGVAVSAAMVAAYGGWVYTELSASLARADALRAQAEHATRADEAERAASAASARAKAANAYVSRAVGSSPDVAAVLALLGDATDAKTSLESVDIREAETGWVCHINGLMQAGDDKAFADAVKTYTENLARSPLVAGVKLGAAARTKMGDIEAHRFDLTIELVEVPYTAVAPQALTAVDKGAAK